MRYELIKFTFKNFAHSHAIVLHIPNWFEKHFLRRHTNVVTYMGWLDLWVSEVTSQLAPYTVKCMLTKEWHTRDHDFFVNQVLPKMKDRLPDFLKSLGLMALMLFAFACHADNRKTVIKTRDYKVEVITVDSVQYIVIPGTGIIKHEPR